MEENKAIKDIVEKARDAAGDLQPWPDYYDSKARELGTILNFCKLEGVSSAIEIGCGNAFTSVLLATMIKKVYAFDLSAKNELSHSMGIGVAEELVRRIGAGNVDVISGSADTLPMGDGSVDLVFSEYALQYVSDKTKALGEMRRALGPGGIAVIIVPNFMERVFAPLMQYKYLAGRSARLLLNMAVRKIPETRVSSGSGLSSTAAARKTKTLGDYLLLKADGSYRSFTEEMLRHRPASWKRLFEENGFEVRATFSTQVLPLGLFDVLGSPAARFISKRMYRVNNAVGNKPVIKNFGYSLGLIAVKR